MDYLFGRELIPAKAVKLIERIAKEDKLSAQEKILNETNFLAMRKIVSHKSRIFDENNEMAFYLVTFCEWISDDFYDKLRLFGVGPFRIFRKKSEDSINLRVYSE